MALNKLRYNFPTEAEDSSSSSVGGCEKSFYIRQTLGRGINESGVLHFSVPSDPDCFTDTSETYMTVDLRVLKADGGKLDMEDTVFLVPGSLQALFKTCVVSLNGKPLPPNDAYSFVGTLVSYLGTSKLSRADMWNPLSGWESPQLPTSQLDFAMPAFLFAKAHERVAGSRLVTFYGRITSDFLMSCAQFLPPGMKLDIVLTRGADSFALASPTGGAYKVELETASVFIKRVHLSASVLSQCRTSLLNHGGRFRYNRLSTSILQIPESSVVFRWNNIYNNGPLPHSLYMGIVRQRAYYGDINSLSNYFESSGLRTLRLLQNGRDVLPIPYTCNYVYKPLGGGGMDEEEEDNKHGKETLDVEASDAMGPYMGLCQMLGSVSNPHNPVTLSYEEFLQGCTIYCFQINTCGGKRNDSGALDLEIEFARPTTNPLMCLCFGEFDQILRFDQHFNIY